MRRSFLLVVLLSLAGAGCVAQGGDPFAYTRKPLYAGTFHLEKVGADTMEQEFWVSDGSIVQIQMQVWVNATAGAATVEILDPSGRVALSTTQSAARTVPLDLGAWTVRVTGAPGEDGSVAGDVGVLVLRA